METYYALTFSYDVSPIEIKLHKFEAKDREHANEITDMEYANTYTQVAVLDEQDYKNLKGVLSGHQQA